MDNAERNPDRRSGKIVAGLIILIAGSILLLRQLGYLFPSWLFTWPMILIIIGLISGVKRRFRNFGSFFMLLIGSVFLVDQIMPELQIAQYIWPVAIIIWGLWMIFGKHRDYSCKNNRWAKRQKKWQQDFSEPNPTEPVPPFATNEKDDYLDTVSVFGGVTKRIFSRDFKGGDIVNIFGGSEIDLTQADITGRVVLDITQVFGGTKIILPPHWHVSSDVAAVFGGIDDKRKTNTTVTNNDKVLVLKGTSIFAGIEIRSY